MAEKKGSKSRGYLILSLFAMCIVAVILFGMTWYFPLPTPPSGPDDGGNPAVYYKTTVTVENPWFGSPNIKKIDIEYLGSGKVAEVISNEGELLLFPFEGKIEAILYYPGGMHYIGSWNIKVEKGDKKSLTFLWYTTYKGKHIIVIKLFDKEDNLIDEKQKSIIVG